MTAYEKETLTQIREIAALKAEVKRLKELQWSACENIAFLRDRIRHLESENFALRGEIRALEYARAGYESN